VAFGVPPPSSGQTRHAKRHPCEAKIPVYRNAILVVPTEIIKISTQNNFPLISALRSDVLLLVSYRHVTAFIYLVIGLINYALNLFDLGLVFRLLLLHHAFTIPQRYFCNSKPLYYVEQLL
jgi:hypothetical protein